MDRTIERPAIFIKTISFNDGTTLPLAQDSIVVFTGANNCGKSQVLKDVELCFDEQNKLSPKIITNIENEIIGNMDDHFFETHFYYNNEGYLNIYEHTNWRYTKTDIINYWRKKQLPPHLYKLFVKLVNTKQRLITSQAPRRDSDIESHPIFKLHKSAILSETLSKHFRQAFREDIVVDSNEMRSFPLYVGKAPDPDAYTMTRRDDYYRAVQEKMHRLDEQGDGMRSFASILLDTFTSDHSIMLIDEPEAFLHPPQARLLGQILAQNNNRQLFISTHSEDFLHGLLDADNNNVTVIRINRKGNINHMCALQNSKIEILWSNPLLRYSNILSGLFHEKVVVCESDYDCLFYQAVMDAIYEAKNEIAPDIMFVHCGGKGRMKDVVRALKALNVTVVAIPDFDIVNEKNTFKPLIEAFGIDWDEHLNVEMTKVYDWLNANQNIKTMIKKTGKNVLNGQAFAAYSEVEKICRSVGLFVVPCGEIECFHKIGKEKKDWVYNEIENSNLATDSELRDAREFVQAIVDFGNGE